MSRPNLEISQALLIQLFWSTGSGMNKHPDCVTRDTLFYSCHVLVPTQKCVDSILFIVFVLFELNSTKFVKTAKKITFFLKRRCARSSSFPASGTWCAIHAQIRQLDSSHSSLQSERSRRRLGLANMRMRYDVIRKTNSNLEVMQ